MRKVLRLNLQLAITDQNKGLEWTVKLGEWTKVLRMMNVMVHYFVRSQKIALCLILCIL